jgi:hypothetical protein
MSRILLQQALELLKSAYVGIDLVWKRNECVDALEAELAKPEQVTVPFPSFMRKRIEEAIDLAINPKGMSVHDGKATVYASDLQRMIAVIDSAPPRKEWVGLTDDEINDFDKKLRDNGDYCSLHFAWGISAKLKEKNDAV